MTLLIGLGCGVNQSPDPSSSSVDGPLVDLDVDTNRNGIIEDQEDDLDEEVASVREGALFLVNNDNDAHESKNYPDNFVGGRDFDLDLSGGPVESEPEDGRINGPSDVGDITSLVVRLESSRMGPGDRVWLRLPTRHVARHVRIFPDRRAGSRQILGPGVPGRESDAVREDRAGDETRPARERPGVADGDTVAEKWSEVDITELLAIRSTREFGLEGLSYRLDPRGWDGTVEIEVEVRDSGGRIRGRDRVCLSVAPFLLLSDLERTNLLYVVDRTRLDESRPQDALIDLGTRQLLDRLRHHATLPPTLAISASGGLAYPYPQDLFEVGYSSVPSAREAETSVLPVLLVPGHRSGPLLAYRLLGRVDSRNPYGHSAVGIFDPAPERSGRSDHFSESSFFGGNLELIPPTPGFPWGRAVRLSRPSVTDRRYVDFLDAQVLQGPVLEFENDWLRVGHIDEVMAFVPTDDELAPGPQRGQRFKILFPSPGLALELLEEFRTSADRGRLRLNKGAPRTSSSVSGVSVDWNVSVDEILNDPTAIAVNRWVERRLEEYRRTLQDELEWRYDPDDPGKSDIIDVPAVFRWDRSSEGEEIWDGHRVKPGCGQPLTPNAVNMLVVRRGGSFTLVFPDLNGPRHDGECFFWTQLEERLRRASILGSWERVETFGWHGGAGGIHCGTNVRRKPGRGASWWRVEDPESAKSSESPG